MNIEKTILSNLIYNEEFSRKVMPFLKPEYFHNITDKTVFEISASYIVKYNSFPSKEALLIDLAGLSGVAAINEATFSSSVDLINSLEKTSLHIDWLLDNTEKFCQDKSIHNAILESIQILDNKNPKLQKDAIPSLLSEALGVCFDTNIGHDYIENADERFEYYHRQEEKVPFDIEFFNRITQGGFSKKTLNVFLAGTHVGKTLVMTSMAASNLTMGKNVLYITMEISEEEISKRIDAKLLDFPISELLNISKSTYQYKIDKLKNKTDGKLIVKQYPNGGAGSANFRHLLNECRIKRNFIPDIIYIDYLNICSSSRLKSSAKADLYVFVKTIAEELRALAIEFSVPIVSATQTNRSGFSNSDPGMEATSESFGLPATVDFLAALIISDELRELNQMMVKQLKNRYTDLGMTPKFVIGVDRQKMSLYNVHESEQNILDGPVMDNSTFGKLDNERNGMKKFNKEFFNDSQL